MKKLYLAVALAAVAIAAVLVASFVYLDRLRHETYLYKNIAKGSYAGSIKIDRYLTEENTVYKSVSRGIPGYPEEDTTRKLVLNKDHSLRNYTMQASRGRTSEFTRLANDNGNLAFLSVRGPVFSYLSSEPIRKGSLPFGENAVLTYLPFLKQYDFRRGGPQAFLAIDQFSDRHPPMKVILTLTSIKDEYLKIDNRKIKTECLLLRIKGFPKITLWVSKLDRSLIMIEVPNRELKIVRTFLRRPGQEGKGEKAIAEDPAGRVSFQNGNCDLSGKLSMPEKAGRSPAVLLICGPGPYNCDYLGLFEEAAEYLSNNGFCVLRFDKRGVGLSGGAFSTYSLEEELGDIEAAIEFLMKQERVDKDNIALLGHSMGGYYAVKLAQKFGGVKGCVVMAMPFYPDFVESLNDSLRYMAGIYSWDREYLKTAARSITETFEIVKNTGVNWSLILRKRCYLKRMREMINERPLEVIGRLSKPVLLLQGNEDTEVSPDRAKAMDNFLEESGNTDHRLIYFGYLGHYFGELVFDGDQDMRYKIDSNVLEAINGWLNTLFKPPEPDNAEIQ
ncbi:alpha/beta hydrolase family protein [Candidatus Omnitrophota bacterium]